jgi:peptidoglycan/LPS O-acetylase OafA/YrhL
MRTNLDLLRAIAVTAVLIDHILLYLLHRVYDGPNPFTALRLGRLGVLIFFVHTFFVLVKSMERDEGITKSTQTIRFYVRRAFRIYPLVWLAVATACIAHIPAGPTIPYVFLGIRGILANCLLIQNVLLVPSAIGPLWSLPYEIQMYLVLPLLFWCLVSNYRGLWLGVFYSGICILVLWGPQMGLHGTFLLEYAPCFLAGGIAFVLEKHAHQFLPGYVWPVGILVAGAGFLAVPLGTESFYRISSWVACLAIGVLFPFCADIRQRSVVIVSHWVAKYSFGIYIVHVPVMWLVCLVVPGWNPVAKILAVVPITAFLSFALYHALEEPCINLGKKLAMRICLSQTRVIEAVNAD